MVACSAYDLYSGQDYIEEASVICYKNIQNIENEKIIILGTNLNLMTILKLEFCNVTAHQIEILAKSLAENNSVKELSLNGNPNNVQNFYLLLCKTKIISLSLKLCSIDYKGIKNISKNLNTPFESSLLHLNLASNWIQNRGIQYIAHFLRLNRTLISLNLADNMIHDMGCLKLMKPLQKFLLNFEEVVVRRRIQFDYQRKMMSLFPETPSKEETVSKSNLIQKLDSRNQKIGSSGSKEKSSNSIEKSGGKSSAKQKKAKSNKLVNKVESKPITNKVDSKVGPPKIDSQTFKSATKMLSQSKNTLKFDALLNHPFIGDKYAEEEEVYCKGNDTLINLNLSYNKITNVGLNNVVLMLRYQSGNYPHDKGISRISTEGNCINNCQPIIDKLQDLLTSKSKMQSSSSRMKNLINSRKRS